jgi:thiamine biosynthesis protein ThiI
MYLVRYSEIALKSEPVRRRWEDHLITNIRTMMPGCKVRKERGRIWLEGDVDPEKLRRVFGIVSFSKVEHCRLDDLNKSVIDYCERSGIAEKNTFALRLRRRGSHDFSSQEKTIEVADLILDHFPHLSVDLDSPDITVHCEIREMDCYMFLESIPGAGGLPLGVEGNLVALMSGGIDSPVAAWLMMKRGCKISPIYVDLFGDELALQRCNAVMAALRRYQPGIELEVIRDDFLQKASLRLREIGMEKYACLICKRRMYRLAEEACDRLKAKGIVTGESLGQVASQTLDNLYVLDEAAHIPIYRPLIGFDKVEAERIARDIGTFDASILPSQGCPFVPRKPSTKAKLDKIREIEEQLELGRL